MTTVIVGMSIADVDRRDEFCAAATQRGATVASRESDRVRATVTRKPVRIRHSRATVTSPPSSRMR